MQKVSIKAAELELPSLYLELPDDIQKGCPAILQAG